MKWCSFATNNNLTFAKGFFKKMVQTFVAIFLLHRIMQKYFEKLQLWRNCCTCNRYQSEMFGRLSRNLQTCQKTYYIVTIRNLMLFIYLFFREKVYSYRFQCIENNIFYSFLHCLPITTFSGILEYFWIVFWPNLPIVVSVFYCSNVTFRSWSWKKECTLGVKISTFQTNPRILPWNLWEAIAQVHPCIQILGAQGVSKIYTFRCSIMISVVSSV